MISSSFPPAGCRYGSVVYPPQYQGQFVFAPQLCSPQPARARLISLCSMAGPAEKVSSFLFPGRILVELLSSPSLWFLGPASHLLARTVHIQRGGKLSKQIRMNMPDQHQHQI
ncbi:Uncharacterized protein Fot_24288 [Forsythia ovata]|uniref:Uncharacterized protein n=1 Tax=Forsythia ovata TaxID=205694 RepID=A0ABD1U5S3_9LAMI